MRRTSALLFCLFVPVVAFALSSSTLYRVKYDGGSLFGLGLGDSAKVRVAEKEIQILDSKEDVLATIPVSSVTEISFGHDVPGRIRRATGVAALTPGGADVVSRTGKNFVGVTWENGERKSGFAVHCDDSRWLVAQLEGVTGKKSTNSDVVVVKN